MQDCLDGVPFTLEESTAWQLGKRAGGIVTVTAKAPSRSGKIAKWQISIGHRSFFCNPQPLTQATPVFSQTNSGALRKAPLPCILHA